MIESLINGNEYEVRENLDGEAFFAAPNGKMHHAMLKAAARKVVSDLAEFCGATASIKVLDPTHGVFSVYHNMDTGEILEYFDFRNNLRASIKKR